MKIYIETYMKSNKPKNPQTQIFIQKSVIDPEMIEIEIFFVN